MSYQHIGYTFSTILLLVVSYDSPFIFFRLFNLQSSVYCKFFIQTKILFVMLIKYDVELAYDILSCKLLFS